MSDFNGLKFGGAQFPLTASTANSLLRDADPSIFYMLDFLGAMLRYHLDARVKAQLAAAGIRDFTTVLAEGVPVDPGPFLKANQFKFPLLAIYRTQDVETEHTTSHVKSDCDVMVQYIMPPLVAGNMRIMAPLLTAIRSIIVFYIQQGFHPSYTPPGKAIGTSAWDASGLMSVGIKSSKVGVYAPGDKLFFPVWSGTVSLIERADWVIGDYENLAGIDTALDLHDPATDTIVADVVNTSITLT